MRKRKVCSIIFLQLHSTNANLHQERTVHIIFCHSQFAPISATQQAHGKLHQHSWVRSVDRRIIESLRLEKASKIMKSNHQPNTTMPTKPCPKVSRLTWFSNTSRDGDSTPALSSLFQCLTTLSVKKFFLISNLNLP